MVKLVSERSMIFSRFVAVDSFFPSAFFFVCHPEDNPKHSHYRNILNGVRILTKEIAILVKKCADSFGLNLFGPAIVVAFRRTQNLSLCIFATIVVPRRDGNAPRHALIMAITFAASKSPTETSSRWR